MKKILAVADSHGSEQHTVTRAAELASRMEARLDIAGFVYEHLANLPIPIQDESLDDVRAEIAARHRRQIDSAIEKSPAKADFRVDVFWEKRIADRVNQLVEKERYDLVVKGGHRSETLLYTPTDWQLLRTCRAPVLLLAEKRWRRSRHVMAAVDLGSRVKSKLDLNYSVVEKASAMATALDAELHVAYAVPFSAVLQDLGMIDRTQLRREGVRRAKAFRTSLEERGIAIEAIHVATGAPEKVLVSLAAKNAIGLVVLGCVGRKKLVGRVLGNTAEQILRLLKADVLAIKP